MVKFTHLADVHLGGWKQPQLQKLNMESFRNAISSSIKEKVDFVLIVGDLFDSAFPSIDTLKGAFSEFRRLHDAKIPCFLIAGSHDYSVSGKTFLDVLENAGFCKNVANFEEREGKLILNPTTYKNIAIYGYPGKTSGMEVKELKNFSLNDAPGMFKILALHTTLDKVKGNLPIDSLNSFDLPAADYYALGHIHITFKDGKFVYPGPTFPNNFQELRDLKHGRFVLVDTESPSGNPVEKREIKLKEVEIINFETENSLTATEKIISEIRKRDLEDKIVLLKIKGNLRVGKNSDIQFSKIAEEIQRKNAYSFLKNTHDLKSKEVDSNLQIEETENIDEKTIKDYLEKNPSDFNDFVPLLIDIFSKEKQEGETNDNFSKRILEDTKKALEF